MAAGLGGVWSDQASVWTPVTSGQPVSALTIAGSVAYAGAGWVDGGAAFAGNGIESTTDGTHWSPVANSQLAGLAVTRIVAAPQGTLLWASTVLASDSPPDAQPGLYAYDPSQSDWSLRLPGDVWDVAWDPVSGTTLAVTSAGIALASSGSPGFVWLLKASGRGVVALNPSGGFYVLWRAATGPISLYSIDAAGDPPTSLPLPPGFSPSDASFAIAVQAAPGGAGGDTLWVGGANLWSSSSPGQNWTEAGAGDGLGSNQHAILPAPDGSIWIANDNGVWVQSVPGIWNGQNTGLANFASESFATAGSTLAVMLGDGLAGGALDSTGASHSWALVPPPSVPPPALLAASGTGGQSVMYAAPANGPSLEVSSDSGATWALGGGLPSTAVPAPNIVAVAAAGPSVWIAGSDGELAVSGDQGLSFTSLSPPAGLGPITALAASGPSMDPDLVLASGTAIWDSKNAGVNWTSLPPPGGLISALALSPATSGMIVAATSTGLYVWRPATSSWVLLPAGLPNAPVLALSVDAKDNLWASTLGRGFWIIPLASMPMSLAVTASPASAAAGAQVALTASVSSNQQPVSGATVTFSASESGASLSAPESAVTDSSGIAATVYTLPTRSGSVEVSATTRNSLASASAMTSIAVAPAAASVLSLAGGAGQSQLNGSVLDLTFKTQDAYGNPVSGQILSFTGPGSFSPATAATDSNGLATVAYTLPSIAGESSKSFSLTATDTSASASVTTTWTETALPTPGYTLSLSPPSPVPPNQSVATLVLQVKPFGGYDQALSLTCSPTCSLSSSTVSPPYAPVTVTASVPADAAANSLTVMVSADSQHAVTAQVPLQGFTLTAAAVGVSVTSGQPSPPLALALAPLNGFSSPISLQASGLPSGWTASFTPASVTIDGSQQTSNVVLEPVASAVASPSGTIFWYWLVIGVAGLFCGIALLIEGRRSGRGRRPVLGGLAVLVLAFACAACGGGGSAPPAPDPPPALATTYTIQITAASGRIQTSIPLQMSLIVP